MVKKIAVELYKEGKLTLSDASHVAGLGAGDMMDLLIENGVTSSLTEEDFKEKRKFAQSFV